MQTIYKSLVNRIPFDNKLAITALGSESFYLLHTIYYGTTTVSDKILMDITGYGMSKHRKYKKDLMDKGYLLINQVGRAQYEYTVGGLNE